MDAHRLRDEKHGGYWLMILGCPLPGKHDLKDPLAGLSGPSFATCATCENQVGEDVALGGADGDYNGAELFPDRLTCLIETKADPQITQIDAD